eukprot:TRINITY_DN152_c0_g2_i1.p1 TRINITY_DN152_c0_g2~~TRINITY_DN152_c0_g2_i1.p1  ORF type:complete len:449 (-),score=83.49 TRINITY_DN152_c0_g2_i1:242-1588(-)
MSRRPVFRGQTDGAENSYAAMPEDTQNIVLEEGGGEPERRVNTQEKTHHHHEPPTVLSSFKHFFLSSPIITAMLVFVPIGIALGATKQNGTAVFILNFLAIIPLAKLLGESTEQLALHTSQSVGGLLNATFGNAVEIIIAIIALKEGLVRVVQASLIGSILSNILLVLGMCFVAGGIYFPVLKFNSTAAQTSSGILFLSVLAVVMPAALKVQIEEDVVEAKLHIHNITIGENGTLTGEVKHHETATSGMSLDSKLLLLSRGTALVMLVVYGLYLFFQLHTHKHFYADTEGGEEEPVEMTVVMSIVFLAVVTVFVAICSEFLVGSIEAITEAWGISETFAGMILLPIVGNAAEHLTAVTVAMKNKLDLSIGVAVGSSQQIAMMVVPLLVILGWIIGQPMSLYFHAFETIVLFMTIIVVHSLIADGESNWLEGAMLLAVYLILGIAFYVL